MKRIFWVLMFALFAFGCKPGIPEDVIEPDKMENILYDMHIVDGYLTTIYIPDSLKKVAAAYYGGIYKKFDTDSASYNRSLNYYYNKPELMQKMYDNIEKRMGWAKTSMNKADSIIRHKKFVVDSSKLLKIFKADTLKLRAKLKPQASSKAKADLQITKKKHELDSLVKLRKLASSSDAYKSLKKKFTADSLSIRKKMKPDSASNAQLKAAILKRKQKLDSTLQARKNGLPESVVAQ
ncbi:DUF4296 domain-containing protein [Pedobacter sp. MW01-1-1]|uniref:DUF4296 domain-containing protein n=1 Tax=Pedobacter sp. MW01-1-1 TaxID=3383027 RepID=UPI003FF01443